MLEIAPDEIERFFESSVAFLGLERGRVSTFLLGQLLLAHKTRTISVFAVTDEIKHLDGLTMRTRTGPADAFHYPPLKGLWKKHFYTDRFLSTNLINYWELGAKRCERLAEVCWSLQGQYPEREAFWAALAHKLTFEAYEDKSHPRAPVDAWPREITNGACRRKGKNEDHLTGEWIVFGKHDGKNYYLAIARHSRGAGDQLLYARLKGHCVVEFPFLFEP